MPRLTHLIIYLRKSRADGENETVEEVLEKHERILQDYSLRTFGGKIPENKIFREVVSGETIEDRPVMLHVISLIQSGDIDGVLVVDPQRLSRGDLSDTGTLSRLFNYTSTLIITPTHTYDISDKYERKFFEMELMRGNDYLEYTKEILLRGRLASVKAGHYIGSVPPYGYDKVFDGKIPTLEINEKEAEIVRLIFKMYTEDTSGLTIICNRLNELGLKPRNSEIWNRQCLRDMISNPVYIGKVRWNRRKTEKKYENGELIKTRPRNDEEMIFNGIHPPIIDDDTFQRAQEIKERRNTHDCSTLRNKGILINPLAGLLYCECGYSMTHKICKTSKSGSSLYYCVNQPHCGCRGAYLEQVMGLLRDSLENDLHEFETKLESSKKNNEDPESGIIRQLKREKDELKKQQNKLYDLLEREVYSEELFRERNASITSRLNDIEASIKNTAENKKTTADYEAMIVNLNKAIEAIGNCNMSAKEKNLILKSVISKIIYRRERSAKRGWDPTPIKLKVELHK